MYIDAIKENDTIEVVERNNNGERIFKQYPANYVFYYEDSQRGRHTSIYGDKLSKFSTNNYKRFLKEKSLMGDRKLFESDINPVFRCFSDHYKNCNTPELNIGFFDIEVNFNKDKGFAPPEDPFNAVTAISLYMSHLKRNITLVLKPKLLPNHEAERIVDKFEDTFLYTDERELLKSFLELLEDIDVLSGWNSTGFDIPYLVNRITLILGKEYNKKWCLWDKLPKVREYEKFKKKRKTYDLVGRVHLDYLELYQKHNPQQLHSYRLDFVAEVEVGENKIPYEGTLDQLYNEDFEKFIEYNRQDVMLLVKIDEKKKFIELSNKIAHANGVLFKTTLGSVALIENAIINEIHNMGFISPDKINAEIVESDYQDTDEDDDEEEHSPVVGAYVADPVKGLHEDIGCMDINSLYPSVIRAIGMSPETIVGQVRPIETKAYIDKKVSELPAAKRADAWEGVFHTFEYGHIINQDDHILTIDFDDGHSVQMTGKECYDYIFNPINHLCVSANGTIFRTDKNGIIPHVLASWYSERKALQAKQKEYEDLVSKETNPETKEEYEKLVVFYNQRQQVYKILLNSLYGSLLNQGLRFYDERVGQSVTLTGRMIARHMGSKTNEIITGEYNFKGASALYQDTDSVIGTDKIQTDFGNLSIEELFNACPIVWNEGEKEYSVCEKTKVLSYDPSTNQAKFMPINYVYRHKVRKQKWKITDEFGNETTVTEDHSVMIERNGLLLEVKPRDILEDDLLITVVN